MFTFGQQMEETLGRWGWQFLGFEIVQLFIAIMRSKFTNL